MAGGNGQTDLRDRLKLREYNRSACIAAIRGEHIPHVLGHPVHRLCVVRGIRYHDGFGQELRGLLPLFTRALNARSIMSNTIPVIETADDVPYCTWHPTTASEDTYRNLVQRYPDMAYHVGRACAVAGYARLLHELDILPDVHIAEEARECGNLAIFQSVISQSVHYSVMNDYTRSVDPDQKQPAYLNGDTAVSWMLDVKQQFEDPEGDFDEFDGQYFCTSLFGSLGYQETTFNITEDHGIDEYKTKWNNTRKLSIRFAQQLLSEPLPIDLPTVDKDLLIVMAAYSGNVDRYSRLRRPEPVHSERQCCIRGIYHNTFFAVWWSKQPQPLPPGFSNAINARFIMNNVLSRASVPGRNMPYLIWWPTVARPLTYRQLAKLQPEMLPQIVRACIYAGYKDLFDKLLPHVTPDDLLLGEASAQADAHYTEVLQKRIRDMNIIPSRPPGHEDWKRYITGNLGYSSNAYVRKYLDTDSIGISFETPYDGIQCNADDVELMACLPDGWLIGEDDESAVKELNYEDWPGQVADATGRT